MTVWRNETKTWFRFDYIPADWCWCVPSPLQCLSASCPWWPLMKKKIRAASSPLHSRMSNTFLTLARGPSWHMTSSRSSRVNSSRLTRLSSRESMPPSSSSTRETRRSLSAFKPELQLSFSTILWLRLWNNPQSQPNHPVVILWWCQIGPQSSISHCKAISSHHSGGLCDWTDKLWVNCRNHRMRKWLYYNMRRHLH